MRRRQGGPWPGRKWALGPQIRCTWPASMTPKQGANAGPEGGAGPWGRGQRDSSLLWGKLQEHRDWVATPWKVEVLGASPRWQS